MSRLGSLKGWDYNFINCWVRSSRAQEACMAQVGWWSRKREGRWCTNEMKVGTNSLGKKQKHVAILYIWWLWVWKGWEENEKEKN